MERNLHDGAQQRLIALSLELGLLGERLGSDSDARAGVDQARREIALSLEELRDVARGLHPAVVSGHGLAVALESLAAGAAVPVRLTVELDGRLPERVEVAAYYVVCESLANIGKHAHASVGHRRGRSDERRGRRRGRRRRGRRRGQRARHRPARSCRPRRGARRPVFGLDPARRRHARPGGDAMRVAHRRGQRPAARGARAPARRRRVRRGRPVRGRGRPPSQGEQPRRWTSRSSTSDCRPRTATRACGRRSRSARTIPRWGCSCCRSTSSWAWR